MSSPNRQSELLGPTASDAPPTPPVAVRHGHLAMIIVAILVSTSFSVGSLIAKDIPPVTLTFARFFLATLVFACIVVITRTKLVLTPPVLYRAAVPGFIYAVYFVTMFTALETVSPLSTGAIFALAPVMSALIAWVILGRRQSLWASALLLIAGAGAIWVVFDGSLEKLAGFKIGYGELIYAFGCLLYASFPTFVQKTKRGDSNIMLTFFSFVLSMLLLFAYDAFSIINTDWLGLSLFQVAALTWLAVVTTAISFFLLQFASLRLPPAKVMAYTYLTPACIVPIEMALANGLPTLSIMIGIAVTIAALTAFELN